MKIIITGASGFVGRLLVDELSSSEHKLLLIGRNKNLLTATFPGLTVGDYGDLTRLGKDFDILVHLAVANNETNHPEKVFFETNVEFLLKTSRTAAQLNIKRFINISTVHALDEDNSTPYARSKRDAAVLLKKENSSSETIYLPLVYGNQWNGKLRFLNRLPRTIANNIFIPIAALKPTLHISELARYIISPTNSVTDDLNILCNDQELNAFYSYTKRGIDLCFAFSVFLLLGWLLALIWILVRLDSPGPGFFVQSRLGRYGNRIFSVFKFRTMLQDTKNQGTHETSINAVTRIGRFLRKTKIDELPQILNIIRNDLSLIGPRPCLPSQTEVIAARKRYDVFAVKPGISGLAQIYDIDMSDPAKLSKMDAQYVALRCITLDIKIAIATAFGRGRGDRTLTDEKSNLQK